MKRLLTKLIFKLFRNIIIKGENKLTEYYLLNKGWVLTPSDGEGNTYIEPNIKERDQVYIRFTTPSFYTVWHGREKTFIAGETTIEWLEMYMLLMDKHKIS